jgi:hypothetical protein
MQEETEYINVYGARVHNLKNIDAEIPRNSLTVITGLSGSGKSSLAFDTIFAEGQRRYIETFSAYARNFLGNLERPDVDKITGLSPVISIEQKTTNKNPRSTVGTTTEVYDYLRLLYARAGEAYSYLSGEKMVKYTEEQILDLILKDYKGKRIYILAPLVRSRKGHYKELFEQVRKKGYLYVRVDGEVREVLPGMKLDRYKNHDVEVVIDKLVVTDKDDTRLKNSVATAMRQGDGLLMILDAQTDSVRHYSKRLMCPVTGLSYREPAPHNFSFNSPQGACPKCKGLGVVSQIDIDKVIPDRELSIAGGAIAPLGKAKNSMIFWQITALLEKYEATLKTPVKDLPEDAIDEILYGSDERIKIKSSLIGTSSDYFVTFEGVVKYIQMLQEKDASATAQKWADQFAKTAVCPELKGENKIKKGTFLCIPYPKAQTEQNIQSQAIPTDSELFRENRKKTERFSTIKAAVILPFLDGVSKSESSRMVEYYEGLLMAVDSLKRTGTSIDLYTYNSGPESASLNSILGKSEMKDMDIIFGPLYQQHIKPLAEFAKKQDTRLVIPFTSKDNTVFQNPAVYQINTPQSYLYSEVYDHFVRQFPNANVIFIEVSQGTKDKAEFIKGLKDELRNRSIPMKSLKEDVTVESLKTVLRTDRENIFIPTSGSNLTLIKILPQLTLLVREQPESRIHLFGYPEWQTYTKDHLEAFFELDTYFYSSFYTNNLLPAAINFTKNYRRWYGKEMDERYPKFGMLGFDTGYFFLKGLARYGSSFEKNMQGLDLVPIQTGFKFQRVNNWGGFINKKVFFVHFTKNFELVKLDFD